MKIFNQTLQNAGDITVTTYYKSPIAFGPRGRRLANIEILTHASGMCTCTIGDDSFIQTITADQALAYINDGGYSTTP